MRVWVGWDSRYEVDVFVYGRLPQWMDNKWDRLEAAVLCAEDARGLFTVPRGKTLYEYEVTAKLVKKIRPPKGGKNA